MLTGKIHIETKKSREQLLVETDVDVKKEWRELNTLPSDYQKQIIATNGTYTKYLENVSEVTSDVN